MNDTRQQEHDNFLLNIKDKMLNRVIVDSAIYWINNIFFDFIYCEGGDDELVMYDSNRFAYQMTIRLTEKDVELWDNDKDLELYNKKKLEVLEAIKQGKIKNILVK